MNLVFDIETDGVKPTKIHCIVAIDEEDKVYTLKPDQIKEGVDFLSKANLLIEHNILGYDIPAIKEWVGVDLTECVKIFDNVEIYR